MCSIEDIEGAMVVVGDRLAMMGDLPDLVRMKCDPEKISRIELP